jgi:hypothetical protein
MKALRVVCGLAPLVGCVGAADVSTTTTTAAELGPARLVETQPAIHEITRAQCARAQACGAVASRGIYRGADYCDNDVTPTTRDELDDCEAVDASRLAACVEAIRNEDCATLGVAVRAPDACRRALLCPAPSP